MQRDPIFAQQGWYPIEETAARRELDRYLTGRAAPTPATAVMVPHAGWSFSGPTAGALYAQVVIPERVVLLCPQHRAGGARAALWPDGHWRTPLGALPVDAAFAAALLDESPLIEADPAAHMDEHSIEIQLPFLKARNPAVRIVPLRLGRLAFEETRDLALALTEVIRRQSDETLIVASSDMSHESDYNRVLRHDEQAREKLQALDPEGLYDTVTRHDITMCGVLPATAAMVAARALGAVHATEVAYTTSADVSGRRDYVVGYAAMRWDRDPSHNPMMKEK